MSTSTPPPRNRTFARLQEVFSHVGSQTTFTERQTERRGTLLSERDVDDRLAAVIRGVRARYGFRTSLSDDGLVAVVRGYYAGDSDAAIAARLGVSAGIVARARINLHLFRPAEPRASFDAHEAIRLLDRGASIEECGAALGASPNAVRRYRRVSDARREARRSNFRYPSEFESILEAANLETQMATTLRADREVFESVRD